MQVSDPSAATRTDAFSRRLRRRHREDARFRFYGTLAVSIALGLLVFLLSSILWEAKSAVTRYELKLDITPEQVDTRTVYGEIREELFAQFDVPEDRTSQLHISGLVSLLAAHPVAQHLSSGEVDPRQTRSVLVPISDDADLYLKGIDARTQHIPVSLDDSSEPGELTGDFSGIVERLNQWKRKQIDVLKATELRAARLALGRLERGDAGDIQSQAIRTRIDGARARVTAVEAQIERLEGRLDERAMALGADTPSLLLRHGNRYMAITAISPGRASYRVLLGGLKVRDTPKLLVVETPVFQRRMSDIQIAAVEYLRGEGRIVERLNFNLLSAGDSSEAEIAGVLAGLVGSLLTILCTMLLAVPAGIAAAVYLEEFAPRTRITRAIQVNINNLASVPSIVFGLLGAAIFINGVVVPVPFMDQTITFGGGLGRGWPIAAGIILALMTLPTIIIASRAALASVAPSTRQAALALGATRLQMVGHHVLPKAGPGILTGSILGLAQALGETAPLLMIGMVAFIGDVPTGVNDRATALPVLIYQWSTRAERAWEPLTSAGIIILLLMLLALNAVAIWLRLRYEKR